MADRVGPMRVTEDVEEKEEDVDGGGLINHRSLKLDHCFNRDHGHPYISIDWIANR